MRRSLVGLLAASLAACGEDEPSGDPCYPATIDGAICDPASTTFSLVSTNRYFPLIVGAELVLEGAEDGETIRVERRVLDTTETLTIGGVDVVARVVEDRETVDGELVEVARDFYAEASDGTVCYFGEDVDNYENGAIANHHGSWRAGDGEAKPGVIMPAMPAVGQSYFQENAPGTALDMSRVTAIGETMTFAGTSYEDVVTVSDINPLESCDSDEEETKRYAPGIGEVQDEAAVLVSFTTGEP